MSCVNCASVTCSGGSSALWHSKQVLAVCARIPVDHAHNAAASKTNPRTQLFCHVAINGHRHDVTQRKHPRSPNQRSTSLLSISFQKRQQHPHSTRQPKSQSTYELTIDAP